MRRPWLKELPAAGVFLEFGVWPLASVETASEQSKGSKERLFEGIFGGY